MERVYPDVAALLWQVKWRPPTRQSPTCVSFCLCSALTDLSLFVWRRVIMKRVGEEMPVQSHPSFTPQKRLAEVSVCVCECVCAHVGAGGLSHHPSFCSVRRQLGVACPQRQLCRSKRRKRHFLLLFVSEISTWVKPTCNIWFTILLKCSFFQFFKYYKHYYSCLPPCCFIIELLFKWH